MFQGLSKVIHCTCFKAFPRSFIVHVSGPLQGHLQVDVLDSAFATIHIGLFGIDFDIFRGEICFKGGIQYGLNILKVCSKTRFYFDVNLFILLLTT